MECKQSILHKIFLVLSVLGSLFVLTETIFHFFGESICSTEGCKVIAEAARFGDMPILLIGLAAFSSLAALSAINRAGGKSGLDKLIDFILIVSLAAEGFFTGYQAFRLFTPCVFCLTVFTFLVVLGFLRLAAGKWELLAGFGSLLAVFSLFYLVLPSQNIMPLPKNEKLVLFYSKECKHCSEVIKQFEEDNIDVLHIPAGSHMSILKSIGIEHVPALFVNNGVEKFFLTGRDAIKRYISSEMEAKNKHRKEIVNINDLFKPQNPDFVVSAPDGACIETAPCN